MPNKRLSIDDVLDFLSNPPEPGDIRALRDAAGWSAERAASAVGVARATWAAWEVGRARMPVAAWMLALMQIAGVREFHRREELKYQRKFEFDEESPRRRGR